jgi:threonine dehydrogenase-like Zn-dependent dehydrogenase
MKALFLADVEEIDVKDVPLPEIENGRVLIRMKSSAICRTDAKMWKMGHRDLVLPRIPGHEICAVRQDNGKRHVVWPGSSCGKCRSCLEGFENLCSEMQIMGFHYDGGLSEFALAPEGSLIQVPGFIPDELACLAEPVACTLNALKMADVRKGKDLLIYGGGPVGLMAALAAKIFGARPVVCEINPVKIKRSRMFQEETGLMLLERPPCGKFQSVINASSSPETFVSGINRISNGGCFCIFSGFTHATNVLAKKMVKALNEAHYRQIKITGAYGCTREQMRLALELIGGCLRGFSLLIESTVSLEEVPAILPKIWEGDALRYVVKFN